MEEGNIGKESRLPSYYQLDKINMEQGKWKGEAAAL